MKTRLLIAALVTSNIALAFACAYLLRPPDAVVLDEVQRLHINTEDALLYATLSARDNDSGEVRVVELTFQPRAAIGLHQELGRMFSVILQTASEAEAQQDAGR